MKKGVFCLIWLLLLTLIVYFPKFKAEKFDDKTITVFAWGDVVDPAIIAEFEKTSGIKVNLNYYSSNEELMVKMRATRGVGYDLIIPSDYAVSILLQENLLKELDHSKLPMFKEITKALLNYPFDPHNIYSIPYEWELFGLGYDTNYFATEPRPSWDLVFDKNIMDYRICMVNDPIEAFLFAGFYLFGKTSHFTSQELSAMTRLLIEQKAFVEAYADFRADYLLVTKNCPVVVTASSFIQRAKKNFADIEFMLPVEGAFLTIENLCIPKASNKDALTYQFINFLFQHESLQKNFDSYGFFPSLDHEVRALGFLKELDLLNQSLSEPKYNIHFFNKSIPQKQLDDMWVEVKSSGEI